MGQSGTLEEKKRLQDLYSLNALQDQPDVVLETFCEKVAKLFDVPSCVISLVLEDRQWFKASYGCPIELAQSRETPRDISFCTHVVESGQPLVVKDTTRDPRFKKNPLVQKYGFGFYAGFPLKTDRGHVLGSLCLYDHKPRDFDEKELQILGLFSERVMAHLALCRELEHVRVSEEGFRALAKASPVGIIRTDARGDCIYVNERWCEITGLTPEESLGEGWAKGIHPVDRERIFSEWYQACKEGAPFKSEYQILRPDGLTTWVLGQAVPEKDNHGKVIGYVRSITDITERKRAEEKLNTSLSVLRATLDSTADGILIVDTNGKIVSFNQKFVEMWNIPEPIVASRDDNRALAYVLDQPKDPEEFLKKVRELYTQPDAESYDVLEFKDGRRFERYSKPQRSGTKSLGRVWSFRDVTKHTRAEETLAQLASFPELDPQPIIEVDLNGMIHYLNPKAARSIPDIAERGFNHPFLSGLDALASSLREENRTCVREIQVGDVWYEQVTHYVEKYDRIRVYARDITDRKQAVEALEEQAVRDSLTGLYNRRNFDKRFREEIAHAERNQYKLAVLLCDLDRFKTVNDTQGHEMGDKLLKVVVKSIQEATRGTDLVFRWGGDEFVVILNNTTRDGVLIVSERIREKIQKTKEFTQVMLDLSIGVAFYPEHGSSPDELMRIADTALYIAKKGGDKTHIGVEEYRLDDRATKVVFQPVVSVQSIRKIGTEQVLGYEALSRDPEGKRTILDLFAKYRAIGKLLDLKCLCFKSQIKAAQEVGLERVFINVDFNVLSQVELIPKPRNMEIILEISELEAIHDVENRLNVAQKWREYGYKFAIDDFGAGFISLPFIARLVPEYIKMDRSTLLQAVSSEPFKEFMIGIIFGLKNYSTEGIIAEGVETEEELKVVKEMGIFLVQGYLFGKPEEVKKNPE